jgi:hypothetical protein
MPLAKRVEKLDSGKMLLIICHDNAKVRFGKRGDNHVQRASWVARGGAF